MAFKDGGSVGHLSPGKGTATTGPGGGNNPGTAKVGNAPPNPMPAGPGIDKPKGGPTQPVGQPIFNGKGAK